MILLDYLPSTASKTAENIKHLFLKIRIRGTSVNFGTMYSPLTVVRKQSKFAAKYSLEVEKLRKAPDYIAPVCDDLESEDIM